LLVLLPGPKASRTQHSWTRIYLRKLSSQLTSRKSRSWSQCSRKGEFSL